MTAADAAATVSETTLSTPVEAAAESERRTAPALRVVDADSENGAIAVAADVGRDNGCGATLLDEGADPFYT